MQPKYIIYILIFLNQNKTQTFPEDLTPRIIHAPTIIHANNNERAGNT